MWLIYALITFLLWGLADIFYKKGNDSLDEGSHYKTGMMVGLVMGIHATCYLIFNRPSVDIIDFVRYLPVSFCYIASMVIGYKGLKYLELSIASPIQNSSGIITSFLLILIFKIMPSTLEWFGIILIAMGILFVSSFEKRKVLVSKFNLLIIIFPLLYAVLDGLGSFLDGILLDNLSIISESAALIAYEYTFFLYAVILFLIFKFKKRQKFSIIKEKNRLTAAILETFGQFFYVFAVASHSYITIPIIASYGTLSVILSAIFLHEKLSRKQYISIILIILGILVLGISEGLA